MRTLVDPDTGELVEVLDENTVGATAYDLPQFRRAVMAQSRETRDVLRELDAAINEKADAEGNYARVYGRAVEEAKREHGATVAKDIAKAKPDVVDAIVRREKAIDAVVAWRARAQLCSEDRASLHRMGEWSKDQERFGGGS